MTSSAMLRQGLVAGDRACTASEAARAAAPGWAAAPLSRRASVLDAVARDLAGASWLVDAIAVASGRPPAEIWSAELLPTVDALRWLAREGSRALRPRRLGRGGLQWFFRPARHQLRWDPFGVVGVVTPANGLLFLAVPQIAAALLGGNAVLWKPAPAGTGVALAVLAIFARAGLPPGVLQVAPGGAESARALVVAGVDKLFFTGSAAAGRALYRLQAAAGRPAVLELAGPHVAIVLADAPVAATARGLAWGTLANAGRNCVSVQLVLAERPVGPRLEAALGEAIGAWWRAPHPRLGPEEHRRLRGLVADATARGARVAYRGPDEGLPALLADVTPGMRAVEEEVGGPLMGLGSVDAADAAVAWVNGRAARLSASIWTADVRRGRRLAERLDVGQVWINDALHPTAHPAVTLAGRAAGGFGSSRGLSGLMEAVQPKVLSEMPLWAPRPHHGPAAPGTVPLLAATAALGSVEGLRARAMAVARLVRALGAGARGPR